MDEKQPKKSGAQSEQDLIRSALTADLDETTVDIFSQDLFAPAAPKKEKPVESGPKPVEAEEFRPPLSHPEEIAPVSPEKSEPARSEQVEPGLSWEKPPSRVTAKEAEPVKKPEPAPQFRAESSPEMELKIEAGEFHSVAAVKEEEKVDQTGEILVQLEKMGDDYLSSQEMKKLFQNVNLIIDLINKALVRMEQLERKLKEKGIL